ncbi:hypothetical protein SRHO_G00200800 [Serrasalmus rhombeus]
MLPRNCLCNLRRAQRLAAGKPSGSQCRGLSAEAQRVVHDRQQRRFVVRLDGGGPERSAVLSYSYRTDRHVQLLSTVVPEPFRGKGVAAQLAKAALDFVVEEQLKATVSCWYIQKYVKENPHHGYQAYIED